MNHQDSVDLLESVQLAVRNMVASLDERREHLPFFTYRLFDDPIALEHGSFDSPHVVGRYLDGMAMAAMSFGLDVPVEAVEALEKRLYWCLDIGRQRGTGLAWNEDTGRQVVAAWGHNQREALLALLALARLRGSEEALERAGTLVRDMARYTCGRGVLAGAQYDGQTWVHNKHMSPPPAQSGRMVRSLLDYYRLCGDRAALELAVELARYNSRECFDPDGTWRAEAGPHVHSITGLITSIIDLAIHLKDEGLLAVGRRAFDNGLKPYRSSFGWVQEMRGTPHERGEANNTADILQSALLLARHVDTGYWEDAERILRNHLLHSQFRDPSLFPHGPSRAAEKDRIYEGVVERAVGGFCFSSPGDFKSHDADRAPINTDLVGGATQGICEGYRAIYDDDGVQLRVNLHFARRGPVCTVISRLPREGSIDLIVTEPRSVLLRLPPRVAAEQCRLWIDGQSERPHQVGRCLCLSEKPRRLRASIMFPLTKRSEVEVLNGKEYRIEWLGECVTAVAGPQSCFHPLY